MTLSNDTTAFDHLGKNLSISMRPIHTLVLCKSNARTHSVKQIKQIAKSIKDFGMTNPILVDASNGVLAGHGRIEALKLLGVAEAPVIELTHLSDTQKRAYVIADNRLAELAGWDYQLLAPELEFLSSIELSFDATVTGFDIPQIDFIVEEAKKKSSTATEVAPELPSGPSVSKKGDLWLLGRHRLLCGDALDSASYERLLGSNRAQMICTDPPYNVPIQGHVGGSGSIQHAEFVMASGEMSTAAFTEFLSKVTAQMRRYSENGSIHFIFTDWRHMRELLDAGEDYAELKNLCVWNKTNGGMGSLYRSKHELVFVYKNGAAPHINNVELGKHGRYRTNVWDYAGVNTFHQNRMDELSMHPTVKPFAMIKDAILDCSNPGGIILDPFGGSGTTLIAADDVNRTAALIELDPLYIDCTLERYIEMTDQEPIHEESKLTYSQVKMERRA